MLLSGTIVAGISETAWADTYPSWSDVAKARHNEAATKAAVHRIENLLAGLRREVKRTQADAEAKCAAWVIADAYFQEAAQKATELQKQADAANKTATESEARAGQMAAQLMRAGGGDLTTTLFVNAGDADSLLYGLGMSTKISEQANSIYERALQDRNTAQSLTDQADVAKGILEQLKVEAENAFKAAQAAATLAASKLQEQQEHQAELNAQLAVLKARRQATEADYLAGVRARTGSGASLGAGEISASGWARPAAGPITAGFGWRVPPTPGASSYHQGVDIGAGCAGKIYAASSGTVSYAGWNGGYGNFILINHGGGISTAYGHIMSGGTLVHYGEHIDVGQNIAKVGSTGTSTGCHLHFEVRRGGVATNPVPFMRNQGISLG